MNKTMFKKLISNFLAICMFVGFFTTIPTKTFAVNSLNMTQVKSWLDNEINSKNTRGSGECVDFCNYYLTNCWGNSSIGGNAGTWKDKCPQGWTVVNLNGSFDNCRMGDLLVEDYYPGHVSVYYAKEGGKHYVVDQNNDNGTRKNTDKGRLWADFSKPMYCFRPPIGSAPATSNISVNFSPWDNGSYTYIRETDASIGQEINVSGGTCTDTGMYLYDANGKLLAKAANGSYYYRIYFKINQELGYTLTKGTTYKYKFYAIVNGKTYWSKEYSFKTGGTTNISVNFSPWENGTYTYIKETDASIGQEINVSGATCTDTGMYLYDANGNLLAKAANGSYYYRIYFKINQELGYKLTPGTTYKYKFYAIVNGQTYWSKEYSFKTTGTVPAYYLDLNGYLDGSQSGAISGYGTADVYINGKLVADDCDDYWTQWPKGTKYEIKDIKAKSGYVYGGVKSGSLSGTIGDGDVKVILIFTKTTIPVDSVTINKSALSLNVGDEATLNATVMPENATNKSVTWSSSNSSIVTVNNGKLVAVGSGTATITASSGNKSANCTVSVSALTNESIGQDYIRIVSVTPQSVIYGDNVKFTVNVEYSLQSKDEGIIYLGVNTDERRSHKLYDEYRVSKGTGTAKLSATVTTPRSWDTIVYVNISAYPHDYSWEPLESDEISIYSYNEEVEEDETIEPVEEEKPVIEDKAYSFRFPRTNVYHQDQFYDVKANQWFTQTVADAFEMGLVKGMSTTEFSPYGDVTVAEAITMAARIHKIYTSGTEDFASNGGMWYQVYLDYAYENGVISRAYYNSDVSQKATRAQFAEIFANAMDDKGLYPISTVADNAIPDVKMTVTYANDVYKLYRAGILAGNDTLGTFSPNTYITRAEASAILARMADTNNRLTFTIR